MSTFSHSNCKQDAPPGRHFDSPVSRAEENRITPALGRGAAAGIELRMDAEINSVAFHKAELESERLRISSVLLFLLAFVAVAGARIFLLHTAIASDPRVWSSVLLVSIIIGYEGWILGRVNRAVRSESVLPKTFWITTTILETSMPALAIAFLPSQQIDAVYRPLASPALLAFFIFIIMSTLRLNPWLSLLSGFVASTTYLCAALYLGWRPPVPGAPAVITQSAVSLNAVTLLFAGVVAGVVTGQIREHVRAALREAETKRKLDAVQHDLQVARSIQQSLLPQQPPELPGFQIAGWNQPADDTGGDYFDWQILPDGRVVVSLADLTGHGIGPALLAAVCRAYARSSFRVTQNLSSALENINQALGADLTTGRFATFVAAMCCPGCPDVEILSAGHGPLFVYSRSEDRFQEVNTHALPIGILPSFQADPSTRVRLCAGDLVLLSSDGLFEWENNQGQEFGVQRMQDVIRSSRDLGPDRIIASLYESVVSFSCGTKQQDDMTAVIIKRV
jgi:serine phosphatase RsbU (regulator of sigma subunit)